MASSPLQTVGILFVAYLTYRIVNGIISRRRFQAFAKQHGCEDPHDSSGQFPYGWRTMSRMMRSKTTGEDIIDDIFAQDFGEYHTVKKTVLDGNEILQTCDPTNLQEMLANQFANFETGPTRRAIFYPLLGNSIFSSDGAAWKHSRALLRPSFSRENINNLAATAKAADSLIRTLGKPDPTTGWTKGNDASPLFFCFTLDTATEFLFGESVGALAAVEEANDSGATSAMDHKLTASSSDGATAASREFAEATQIAGDFVLFRLRMQSVYWLADGLKFRRAIRVIWRFVDGFVDKALAKLDAEGKAKDGSKKHGLLEELVEQTTDREDLVAQSLAVMMAGRDTTAGLLGWSLMRLALHPDIFTNLRAIILRDFPADSQPDFAQLKDCRPLQHFLQEVLRLHPTVPINNRLCIKDTTLPLGGGPDQRSPIAVRAGQTVVFSVYLMHRRKDLWGEDALEFKPSRWEKKIPAWQWLPFLGGPRVCLGQQFALTEAAFLLVRLLREFDGIQPLDEGELKKMKKGMGLTMWPVDGVKVRFHKSAS